MGDEKLRKWALATEIIAGVAVIFTLGLLVYETRQNTNSIQAQTYQALQSELNEYRRMFVDREFSEDLRAAQQELREFGFENLSQQSYWDLYTNSTIIWGIYEGAFFSMRRGVVGDQEWERFESGICNRLENEGRMWDTDGEFRAIRTMLTSDFVLYVEELCR